MDIGEASTDDIAEIQRVRLSVHENVLGDPTAVQPHHIAEMIEGRGKGWVCRVDGTIRGIAFADLRERNIWALFVEPGFDRRGMGRRLHDLCVGWLFENGAAPIWLTTEPGTRAEDFYRAASWVAKELVSNGDRRFQLRPQDWRR